MKHRAILVLDFAAFEAFFQGNPLRFEPPLPKDLRVLDVFREPFRRDVVFCACESEEFPEVPLGAELPKIHPMVFARVPKPGFFYE